VQRNQMTCLLEKEKLCDSDSTSITLHAVILREP